MRTRAYWGLIALLSWGCALVEYSTEPDPAWKRCKEDPTDPRCMDADARVDAAMDAATADADEVDDAGRDAGANCTCTDDDKPVCSESTGQCVQCTEAEQCAEQTPVCAGNQCVGCSTSSECTSRTGTPACDPATGACVECTAASAALCTGAKPVCDPGSDRCVACNVNEDCKDAAAPICEDHACRACTADADCQGQGRVCRVETGACVECVPNANDPMQENCSNRNACHPTRFTCSGAPRRTVSSCVACVSDSECVASHRCVVTQFNNAPHGTYCLLQQGAPACPNQYAAKRAATSMLGVAADYCFPDDAYTTCEGIREYETVCTAATAALCGDDNLPNDALCSPDNSCTYGCDSDRDCVGSAVGRCFGGAGANYCRTN